MIISSALNLICSLGAEIAVMASEGALIIAGAVALFILARKAYPRTHENAPDAAVENKNDTVTSSALSELSQEKQNQLGDQPEIELGERPTNDKTEAESAGDCAGGHDECDYCGGAHVLPCDGSAADRYCHGYYRRHFYGTGGRLPGRGHFEIHLQLLYGAGTLDAMADVLLGSPGVSGRNGI